MTNKTLFFITTSTLLLVVVLILSKNYSNDINQEIETIKNDFDNYLLESARDSQLAKRTSSNSVQVKSFPQNLTSDQQVEDATKSIGKKIKRVILNKPQHYPSKFREELEAFDKSLNAFAPSEYVANPNLSLLLPNVIFPNNGSLGSEELNDSLKFLVENHSNLFGFSENVTLESADSTCLADKCFTTINKRIFDIPSNGYTLKVTTSKDSILSIVGHFSPVSLREELPPMLSSDKIQKLIKADYYDELFDFSVNNQIEALHYSQKDFYVQTATAKSTKGELLTFYLDPRTQAIVKFQSDRYDTNASGVDYSGNIHEFSVSNGPPFKLIDETIFDDVSVRVFDSSEQSISTYQLSPLVSSNNLYDWSQSAVSAMTNMKLTKAFFDEYLNFTPQNDFYVYLDLPKLDNAFATGGNVFAFGAGDVSFDNLIKAKDIFGHEFAHGYIQSTSPLNYRFQSGALNESISDLIGSFIEGENWSLGESITKNKPALRNMANPSVLDYESPLGQRVPYPDHMRDYLYVEHGFDQGGVHINSSIPNKAFFLMLQGLAEQGLGQSIARDEFFRLLETSLLALHSDINFLSAAKIMYRIAQQEYSVTVAETVKQSWSLVGIDVDSQSSRETQLKNLSGDLNYIIYLSPILNASTVNRQDNLYHLYGGLFTSSQNKAPVANPSLTYGPLNSAWSTYTRPSVSMVDEYHYMTVISTILGIQVYWSKTGDYVNLVDDTNTKYNNVVINRDADTLAMSFAGSRSISLFDLDSELAEVIEISGPVFSEKNAGGLVISVDSLRYDQSGRKIVFDYLSCTLPTFNQCKANPSQSYWSIGVLEVASKQITYPYKTQGSNIDLTYPAFSNNTDQVITYSANISVDSVQLSLVNIFNSQTRETEVIANTKSSEFLSEPYLPSPSFTSNDEHIVFSYLNDLGNEIVASYALENFAAERDANNERIGSFYHNFLSSFAYVVPVVRPPDEKLSLSRSSIDFGEINKGKNSSIDLCIENESSATLFVKSLNKGALPLISSLPQSSVLSQSKLCSQMTLETASLPLGTLEQTVSITHDGTNSPLTLSVSATITALPQPDFDNDGIVDAQDNDDDNDGMPDDFEILYGLNPKDNSDKLKYKYANLSYPDFYTLYSQSLSQTALDIDGNGRYDALTDGILLLRYMFGFFGDTLTNGVIGANPMRHSSQEILTHINMIKPLLDIDENGTIDALSDGVLILRFMFGFQDKVLIDGVVGDDSLRHDAADIYQKLQELSQ